MGRRVTEETKSLGRSTWSELFTRFKDPTTVVVHLFIIVGAFWGGIQAGLIWFVDPKIDALQTQVDSKIDALRAQNETLNETIEYNSGLILDYGNQISRMESTLEGTSGWVGRLDIQVKENTKVITEVNARGTPD